MAARWFVLLTVVPQAVGGLRLAPPMAFHLAQFRTNLCTGRYSAVDLKLGSALEMNGICNELAEVSPGRFQLHSCAVESGGCPLHCPSCVEDLVKNLTIGYCMKGWQLREGPAPTDCGPEHVCANKNEVDVGLARWCDKWPRPYPSPWPKEAPLPSSQTTSAASPAPSSTSSLDTDVGPWYTDDGCETEIAPSDDFAGMLMGPEAKAAVRCCSMDGTSCMTKISGQCHDGKTHAEAEQICASVGRRLCTKAEMDTKVCCGTGCNFDSKRCWMSDRSMPATATTTTTTTTVPSSVSGSFKRQNQKCPYTGEAYRTRVSQDGGATWGPWEPIGDGTCEPPDDSDDSGDDEWSG